MCIRDRNTILKSLCNSLLTNWSIWLFFFMPRQSREPNLLFRLFLSRVEGKAVVKAKVYFLYVCHCRERKIFDAAHTFLAPGIKDNLDGEVDPRPDTLSFLDCWKVADISEWPEKNGVDNFALPFPVHFPDFLPLCSHGRLLLYLPLPISGNNKRRQTVSLEP